MENTITIEGVEVKWEQDDRGFIDVGILSQERLMEAGLADSYESAFNLAIERIFEQIA